MPKPPILKPVQKQVSLTLDPESSAALKAAFAITGELKPMLVALSAEIKKLGVKMDVTKEQVSAEIQQAADEVKAEVKAAVVAAVSKETAEIVAQIEKLKQKPSAITRADLDALVTSVKGVKDVAAEAASEIDKISTNDGGDVVDPPVDPPVVV